MPITLLPNPVTDVRLLGGGGVGQPPDVILSSVGGSDGDPHSFGNDRPAEALRQQTDEAFFAVVPKLNLGRTMVGGAVEPLPPAAQSFLTLGGPRFN